METGHEPVIVERDGRALAAVVPIELYRQWVGEPSEPLALFDELEAIGRQVPTAVWEKLPPDGAANVDRQLYGKRPRNA